MLKLRIIPQVPVLPGRFHPDRFVGLWFSSFALL